MCVIAKDQQKLTKGGYNIVLIFKNFRVINIYFKVMDMKSHKNAYKKANKMKGNIEGSEKFPLLFFILGFLLFSFITFYTAFAFPNYTSCKKTVTVWFFYSEYCPHCHKVLESGILKKLPCYVNLKMFEVANNKTNREFFFNLSKRYKFPAVVPTAFIFRGNPSNYVLIQGDEPIIKNIIPEVSLLNEINAMNSSKNILKNNNAGYEKAKMPKSKLKYLALVVITALADSITPCIMSVLILLLASLSLMNENEKERISKKKMNDISNKLMRFGMAYVVAVYISYFILGLLMLFGALFALNTLTTNFESVTLYIKSFVSAIVIFAGLINIKDFFYYGKGIYFGLPKKYKSKMEYLAKKATFPAILTMAAILTIVEFPCAGIMYFALIMYMVMSKVPTTLIIGYLILYNLIFVTPLIIMVFAAKKGVEKIDAFRMKYRKVFRLILGIVLVVLGVLLFKL